MSYASIMKGFNKLARKLEKYAAQQNQLSDHLEGVSSAMAKRSMEARAEATKAFSTAQKLITDYNLEGVSK